MVHARRRPWRGTEEHRWEAEDLPQPTILEPPRDEPRKRLSQQSKEATPLTEHLGREHRSEVGKGRVQELALGKLMGFLRGLQVVVEPEAGAVLDSLEDVQVLVTARGDVDRIGLSLEVDAVAGIQRDERQLFLGGGAQESVEVVEDLGHQIPRGAGVEPKAVLQPNTGAPAEHFVLLEQGDFVPRAGQERRGRKPGDASTDDDDLAHAGSLPVAAASASRAFTGFDTRTRTVRRRATGVARRRRDSSAKRNWASATARRLLAGSLRSAAVLTARSASMSSSRRCFSSSVRASARTPGK